MATVLLMPLCVGLCAGCGGGAVTQGTAGGPGGSGPDDSRTAIVLECPDGEQLEVPKGDCAWAVCGTDDVVIEGTSIGDIGSMTGLCTPKAPGWAVFEAAPDAYGVSFPSLMLVPDPSVPGELGFPPPIQFHVTFPDSAAVAPTRFTNEDKATDCAAPGSGSLPHASFGILPGAFCTGCTKVWFYMGCVDGCAKCGTDEYAFEIESVEGTDVADAPINLSGTMKGRLVSPANNFELIYGLRFSALATEFTPPQPN